MMAFQFPTVLIRGGGDLATGVAWRLYRCGFPLLVLELAHPLVIRREVSFANAVFAGECTVEGVRARLVEAAPPRFVPLDHVPVLVDPEGRTIKTQQPDVVVDARMTKGPNDTRPDMARLVVGLGPGFEVGKHCHLAVETQRGHFLGRVYAAGSALPDSGVPGRLGGHDVERVVRAPRDGVFETRARLGDRVAAGQEVGAVEGAPVVTAIAGTLRGLLAAGTPVRRGVKVGDVDPRPAAEVDLDVISDKSRAIGGAVVEAILARWQGRV